MSDATDVLQAIDQLRRDLSGYHGQLKAHNDLQRHCDHQRERIAELEAIHARDKAENTKLRELVVALYHIHFGNAEESWDAWEDFCPCGICEERHGGEAPCAYTAKDLADECCEPITKEIVIDRMREFGVEVGE